MNAAWGGQCSTRHVALNLAIGHKTTENLLKKKAFTLSISNLDNLVLSDYFGLVSGHKTNKILPCIGRNSWNGFQGRRKTIIKEIQI